MNVSARLNRLLADVIKADPFENVLEYDRVIDIAGGLPVLVRGGDR